MEETVKERILKFIKHKNITMKYFENQCGLSTGYVTSMRKGFGSTKLNNVLSAFPELNREWLLYGEGNMLNPSPNIDMTRYHSPGDNDVYGNILKNTQNSPTTNEKETEASLKKELSYLRELLKEKERLISEKDERISELTERINELKERIEELKEKI